MYAKELPCVHRVVGHLFADQGMEDPYESFVLPIHFNMEDAQARIDWVRVQVFLATLTEKDLETFAVGDQEDQTTIAKTGGIEGDYAHCALDTLFMVIGG
jgi:hypothetical protein